MTIIEAINRLDALKHNTYTQTDKVQWLSGLDGMVKKQVIDAHEGGADIPFSPYDDSTDTSTVLLIPAPFDEAYLRWLEAQIDYHNGEYDKYNNAITVFNTVYEGFQAHYTRSRLPAGRGGRFLF